MPKRELEADKKEVLLAAARKEFAARGYEAASLNRILEEAGFSKGSFYWYFEDKTDLAATILLEEGNRSSEPLKTLRLPESVDGFWDELKRVSLERLKRLESDRVRYEALMRIGNAIANDPKLLQRMGPAFAEGRRLIAAFFQRGVALGALRSDIPVATQMQLIETVKTTLYKSMYPGDQVPSERELEAFTDLVMDLAQRMTRR